nr:DUF1847 domain-containing protein [Methanobacterium formicicum]
MLFVRIRIVLVVKTVLKMEKELKKLYTNNDINLLEASSAIEARYYMEKTRIEELILFSKEMGYERLGMAFCVGLEGEARQIGDLLQKDFKVDSVCCKVCGIDKSEFNLEQIDKKSFEVMCNPVGQANILNEKKNGT